MQIAAEHNALRKNREYIPESEKHLIPSILLTLPEHIHGGTAYRLLDITHIQEAWE